MFSYLLEFYQLLPTKRLFRQTHVIFYNFKLRYVGKKTSDKLTNLATTEYNRIKFSLKNKLLHVYRRRTITMNNTTKNAYTDWTEDDDDDDDDVDIQHCVPKQYLWHLKPTSNMNELSGMRNEKLPKK